MERDLEAGPGDRLPLPRLPHLHQGVRGSHPAGQGGRGSPSPVRPGPHYLVLCDEDLQDDGRFRMNPPIRSAADRDALLEGLLDGTIDCIATDHAPTAQRKNPAACGAASTASWGWSAPSRALHPAGGPAWCPWRRCWDPCASIPGSSPARREIAEGPPADLTVLDLNRPPCHQCRRLPLPGPATPLTAGAFPPASI